MAEDGLIGFMFKESEQDLAHDMKIMEATQLLFSEVGFESPLGRLAEGEDEIRLRPAEFDGDASFENFDFVESFDFGM